MTDIVKQKVLITIDTEGPAGSNPVDSLIYGKTNSGFEYGIKYLMDKFDEYSAKGLFFVDFAEAFDYGEDSINGVVKCITDRGHNVGVHIHPDHMGDKQRRYLWQYDYSEQYDMIYKCTELYRKMLGKKPLSFRAGRYGANNETIKILDQLGYKYDMSEFYGNKYCKIFPPVCMNRVLKIQDTQIVEVPVTSFRSFKSFFYTRFDKIDCVIDTNEFKRVMRKLCEEKNVDVVSFFVHSFSVLDWRKNPDNPVLNRKLNNRLINQLEWINNCEHAEFISEDDLIDIDLSANKYEKELNLSQGIIPYWFFFKRALSVIRDRCILNV